MAAPSLCNLSNLISAIDGSLSGRHCGSQHELSVAGGCGFSRIGFNKFLQMCIKCKERKKSATKSSDSKTHARRNCTHPAEQSKPLFVLWGTSTGTRVLPVQIQTIKSMSPQEFDGRLDEFLTICRIGHHDGESKGKVYSVIIGLSSLSNFKHIEELVFEKKIQQSGSLFV